VLADTGLKQGDVLSEQQVAELLRREAFQQALQQAFLYLSYRPRSEHELRRYLGQKGHAPETIEATLEKLRGYHYVDDQLFAQSWVENRQKLRPRGPRLLHAELRQKGIERDLADQAIADGAGDEREKALEAARRKLGTLKADEYVKFSSRLGGFLQRRGFAPDVTWDVVRTLWREQTGEVAEPVD
jgi:regulatory protein